MTDLRGRVAIVTGGTLGIGRAIAEALLGRGASVVIGARTPEAVESVAAELTARFRSAGEDDAGAPRALGVICDVRSSADCARLVERAVEELGRLDVLVNNAGVGRFGEVADLSVEDWDATIETNLSGVFYCSRSAIPHLRAAGESWIINIGSLAGKNAFPGGGAYNASKFGLIGFSEALMQEVRHDGIRVSYIMPGSVATEGFRGGVADWKVQPEDIGQIVLDLLDTPGRTLPSRVEVRPSRPPKK